MKTGFLLNETVRLETLRSYAILDTPPDHEFDDLARLAAGLCDAPVSLIIPRNRFYCTFAVDSGRIMVIEDTRADERFAEWPTSLVYRFYAGVPLLAPNGAALGTLCVLDEQPRALSDVQRERLKIGDLVPVGGGGRSVSPRLSLFDVWALSQARYSTSQ